MIFVVDRVVLVLVLVLFRVLRFCPVSIISPFLRRKKTSSPLRRGDRDLCTPGRSCSELNAGLGKTQASHRSRTTKLYKLAYLELYLLLTVKIFLCYLQWYRRNEDEFQKLRVQPYDNILPTRSCYALRKDSSITYGKDYKNFDPASVQHSVFGYNTANINHVKSRASVGPKRVGHKLWNLSLFLSLWVIKKATHSE